MVFLLFLNLYSLNRVIFNVNLYMYMILDINWNISDDIKEFIFMNIFI